VTVNEGWEQYSSSPYVESSSFSYSYVGWRIQYVNGEIASEEAMKRGCYLRFNILLRTTALCHFGCFAGFDEIQPGE